MSNSSQLDLAWLLVCTVLVFGMQAGFCCLETGFVRAKNNVNVALKNLADFMVAGLLFWLAGFAVMFGQSWLGLFGTTGWAFDGSAGTGMTAFLLFQMMFCGTAATIVSGAVAERMKFSGYLVTTVICSAVIYPIYGHWAWGGAAEGNPAGWLARLGFMDFAGSTVVHSVGGWVSLAAVLVIGRRLGAFSQSRHSFDGANLPVAALGTLILWFGWFGFNGGSGLAFNDPVSHILLNTTLGGCAGGIAGMAICQFGTGSRSVAGLLNGTLAGLVAITANCNVVSPLSAVIIGAGGGAICIWGTGLLTRLKIDDAVGAIPVHLFAGVWGTLAVALFGHAGAFPDGHGRLEQLGIQALGIAACGAFVFPVAYLLLRLVHSGVGLRVSREAEELGLNFSEHATNSPLGNLIRDMESHSRRRRVDEPVRVEAGSDVELIAIQYNKVAGSLAAEARKLQSAVRDLELARDEAEAANKAKSAFLANMSHELRTPLNAIIGFSEIMTSEIYGPLGNPRYAEHAADVLTSGRLLLSIVNDILDHSKIENGMMDVEDEPVDLAELASGCLRMVGDRADTAGVGLRNDVPDGLPPLISDRRSIQQIMLNLLSNALKFTPAGGHVAVRGGFEDGRLWFSVADNGIGMAPGDIQRALQPFVQLDNHLTKRFGGTGLGLALVQSLVRLHGAELDIDSAPGDGTEMKVVFPAERTGSLQSGAAGVSAA